MSNVTIGIIIGYNEKRFEVNYISNRYIITKNY